MTKIKRLKKAFTLVELVVVIAVVAILAAVSVGAYFGITESANASKVEQETRQLITSIKAIALGTSENQSLDKTGLHIVDLDIFTKELREMSNIHYDVCTSEQSTVYGPTVVLSTAAGVSGLPGSATTYTSFSYYTNEAAGIKGVYNVIEDSYSKEEATFSTGTPLKTAAEVQKFVNDVAKENNEPVLVEIGADMVFDDHLLIDNRNIVLDLNGYTISAKHVKGGIHSDLTDTKKENYYDVITLHVVNGGKLTVTGNGNVTVEAFPDDVQFDTAKHSLAVVGCYPGSRIKIENGTFTTLPGDGECVLYAKETGIIEITGGTFGPTTVFPGNMEYYVFNRLGNDDETYFIVSGGTFYHNDPSAWKHGEKEFNFVAKDYEAQHIGKNPNIYKVVKTQSK